jgi:hypothetical protein
MKEKKQKDLDLDPICDENGRECHQEGVNCFHGEGWQGEELLPRPPDEELQASPTPPGGIIPQSNIYSTPGAYVVSPDGSITRASAAISSGSSVPSAGDNLAGDAAASPPALPSLVEAEPVISSVLVDATPIDAEKLADENPVLTRRKRLCFLGAFVVMSVVVGVVVWATTRKTSGQPPALQQEQPKCLDPQAALNSCVGYNGSGISECEGCVVSYWPVPPGNVTSCRQVDDETCRGVSACTSCRGCEPEFFAYYECAIGCPLVGPGCPGYPSRSPVAPNTPTASPTPVPCQEEDAAYDRCIRGANGGDPRECIDCAHASIPGHSHYFIPNYNVTCADLATATCSVVAACPVCGDCEAELVVWTNCINQAYCEGFSCPGAR